MNDVSIALDAMGGDHAPSEVVKGAVLAAAEYAVEIILVGQEDIVRKELAVAGGIPNNITIFDAREIVTMEDTALAPLRRKRNSSVRVCANLVAEGRAKAFVSAGNTGATWTSARAVMGMIEGVSRPALATVLPSLKGHTLLLDVGANVDTKSSHLREFAVMGHFYAQMLFDIEAPRVGLLSIGEEEGKGNELTKETFRVLKETGLNFIGNAEGRDVYNGNADVIVCDGFIGNVVLKASEALGEFVWTTIRQEMKRTPLRKLGGLLAKSAFVDLKKRMDYSEYGGAPLLGVKGGCIVCHGRSNAKAIKNAIRVARNFAINRIDEKIMSKVNDLHKREHDSSVLAAQ
ncbi:MAG: phosphate acyltransferase [Thermoanaerobaculia bacterium]|jgi:glycerol-3-phosphate acyltransferase PlsX|nr:phosphate acyltransferase [Thermoanaerobaculia bacterium]